MFPMLTLPASSSRLSGEKTPLFPMFVKVAKRRCLVVGAGKTAEEKIPTLLRCGAHVFVVAPAATRTIQGWASENKIVWEQRRFESHDLDRMFLVVVATPVKTLNRSVFEQAQQRGILCNVVRDRWLCGFYYPPWCTAVRCKSRSRPPATAGPWRRGYANNWNRSSVPSGRVGCVGLERHARSSLYDDPLSPKRRRTIFVGWPARRSRRNSSVVGGYPSNHNERP